MSRYILDTNIFNRIADGKADISMFGEAELYATHIELNELQNTTSDDRRDSLLAAFNAIGPSTIPTESAVFGVSEWGGANWTSDDNLYVPIVDALNAANGGKPSNERDALIAETAIRNGLTLVTEDRDLAKTSEEHGAEVLDLRRFVEGQAGSGEPH